MNKKAMAAKWENSKEDRAQDKKGMMKMAKKEKICPKCKRPMSKCTCKGK